jgi:hypothetical protein
MYSKDQKEASSGIFNESETELQIGTTEKRRTSSEERKEGEN